MEMGENKNIYIVRHGESVANALDLCQGPDEELSEKGIKQAKFLAERVANIDIDLILSSTMKRARDTAETVSAKIKKKVEYFEEFVETKRPTELIGTPARSEECVRVLREIGKRFSDTNWRYSDEENFEDLKARSLKGLSIIVGREEKNILLLSHGQFIRVMIMTMMYGDKMHPDDLLAANGFLRSTNTGITWCIYYGGKKWEMRTWMDHAHLG
jgi:broad specificity phosphatase PhoE